MSSKCYIDKCDIAFGTEVEWGIDRCGEVVDFMETGVETYLIVRPYDVPDECVLIPKSNVEPYIYK
jgi:ribosomal 30S subunit maturation factor RimM